MCIYAYLRWRLASNLQGSKRHLSKINTSHGEWISVFILPAILAKRKSFGLADLLGQTYGNVATPSKASWGKKKNQYSIFDIITLSISQYHDLHIGIILHCGKIHFLGYLH